jgi:hypothetical protein
MGSGGGVPIGLPIVAVNTTNRAEITEAISAQLGDPGIPKPNQLGEISPATTSALESFEKERDSAKSKVDALTKDWFAKRDKADKLGNKYEKAQKKLPQGDPSLVSLKDEWSKASQEYWDALDARQKAAKEFEAKYG